MSKALVHVDSYYKSLNKHGEELCGDKVSSKRNEHLFLMVLADGLGSGVKANILSTLTSTIIREMRMQGATLKETVETIAATLPVCHERQVAYSTFTILEVNNEGQAHLVEFDNPQAIVLRNRKVIELTRTQQEVGGKWMMESTFEVEPDDHIVFFSDGIIHAGVGQTLNFGWQLPEVKEFLEIYTRPEDSAKDVVQILLANVNNLYGGEPGDDSTVACARIVEAKETRVMVGPPIQMEDDEKVVRRLLEATGKKVCCGGTTSNIVSRITGEEIEMPELTSLVQDVPPMASIRGIDLVTEGVLTLQKVIVYLRKCVESPEFMDDLLSSSQQDGATCLVRCFLLDSTQITFMVGRSDNPAHKALAYSTISINAKIALIQEIKDALEKLGKIVSVELY